jgi:hypothetical protein
MQSISAQNLPAKIGVNLIGKNAVLYGAAVCGPNETQEEKTTMHDAFLEILHSAGRSPAIPPADDLYGWLIGSWELDLTAYDDDGNVTRSKGEAHFGWVLQGLAVQDVFINPRRADRGPESPKFANWYGTTIRVYDPSIHAWRVSWFNPHDGFRAELIGRRFGDDIVQEGQFPDGTPIRWSFSEIAASSCRWRGERLERDGKMWRLQVEFRARRA